MITVTVSPSAAAVKARGTQGFSATVAGDDTNAGVTWSTDKGSVGRNGWYTAPDVVAPEGEAVKVCATSKADQNVSSFALVSLTATEAFVEPTTSAVDEAKAILDQTVVEISNLAKKDLLNPTTVNAVLGRLKKSILTWEEKRAKEAAEAEKEAKEAKEKEPQA